MPTKSWKQCNVIGCPELTKDKYCESHSHLDKKNKQDSNRLYEQTKRDQVSKAFYNSKEWKTVRAVVLQRDYGMCQMCKNKGDLRAGNLVDHIVPLRSPQGWPLRLTPSNLQTLCHPCHNTKTQQVDKEQYGL